MLPPLTLAHARSCFHHNSAIVNRQYSLKYGWECLELLLYSSTIWTATACATIDQPFGLLGFDLLLFSLLLLNFPYPMLRFGLFHFLAREL